MRAALDTVARLLSAGRLRAQELDWSRVRYPHAAAVRAQLAESHAPATAGKILRSALRGVLGEAWRLGLVTAEDYHRAVDIPAVRGSSFPRGPALAAGELRALLEDCAAAPRPAAARDATLLAVLHGAGLRRSEAVCAMTCSGVCGGWPGMPGRSRTQEARAQEHPDHAAVRGGV